ncbi:hypothetical protein VTO42DRAFT_9034 [Malbranchea cinnamomea]
MSTFRHICLRCQMRQVTAPPQRPPPWQQAVRFASTRSRLRTPSRMVLSPDVAKSSTEKKSRRRLQNSPWGAMNQTEARLRDRPPERSRAELKRSSRFLKDDESDRKDRPLFKALKMQEALTSIPYERRNAIKSRLGNITSFDQFKLLPCVREALEKTALPGLKELTPTPIQRLALIELLKGPRPRPKDPSQDEDDLRPKFDQFLLAAETGSGKTLGYLLPVVDAVKRADIAEKEKEKEEERRRQEEEKAKEQDPNRNVFELDPPELNTPETSVVARPKAIILVPTSELVNQVGSVVKQLSHIVKYRSALLASSYTPRRIRNSLFAPAGLDIIVTTPHLIASIGQANPFIFSRVTHLVVDEADSLFDKSFRPVTTEIIERTAPTLSKLILCSATIPKSLDNYLREHFPDIKRLVTPNLHSIPRRVQLGVVDIDKAPYRGNRNMACADIIWSLGKAGVSPEDDPTYQLTGIPPQKNILVFVNERETAEEVAKYLASKGINAIAFSRDTTEKRQEEALAEFTMPRPQLSPEEISLLKKEKLQTDSIPFEVEATNKPSQSSVHRLQNTKVLVVTDIGSRGIDTVSVKYVILYDVPHTSIDFIHRLGRVGRMNRRGRGIVLIGKKDRKDIVREVREAMYKGQALI